VSHCFRPVAIQTLAACYTLLSFAMRPAKIAPLHGIRGKAQCSLEGALLHSAGAGVAGPPARRGIGNMNRVAGCGDLLNLL